MALDWTVENYTGANCSGTDGQIGRVLTLQNTSLTNNNGLLMSYSTDGENYLILKRGEDFTVNNLAAATEITFLIPIWDANPLRIRYYVKTQHSWAIENLSGSDADGVDAAVNRVITLSNAQETTEGGMQVTASGLTLMRDVEYNAEHKDSGTEITFLEKLWDTQDVVIKYYLKPLEHSDKYAKVRDDIQGIILEHGINANIIRRSYAQDSTGVDRVDSMGASSQASEDGWNKEYYNIFVRISNTQTSKREIRDMGVVNSGVVKGFFFHEYPDSVTGNGDFKVKTGDILVDENLQSWRIEEVSIRVMQGQEVFRVGTLNKIDLDND